eukprot:881292-Rhodomonas_salina.2
MRFLSTAKPHLHTPSQSRYCKAPLAYTVSVLQSPVSLRNPSTAKPHHHIPNLSTTHHAGSTAYPISVPHSAIALYPTSVPDIA